MDIPEDRVSLGDHRHGLRHVGNGYVAPMDRLADRHLQILAAR